MGSGLLFQEESVIPFVLPVEKGLLNDFGIVTRANERISEQYPADGKLYFAAVTWIQKCRKMDLALAEGNPD